MSGIWTRSTEKDNSLRARTRARPQRESNRGAPGSFSFPIKPLELDEADFFSPKASVKLFANRKWDAKPRRFIYNRAQQVNVSLAEQLEGAFAACAAEVEALYARCNEAAPNYGISPETFRAAIRIAIDKYLVDHQSGTIPSAEQIRQFIQELQTTDLFLALACARGNEHAWWEFDQSYRRYIERIARHLASAETDAEEVIDSVYVELYGTRVVNDVRQSKFATYTGRGTLRGWLRTVVWHAVIDLHRARHDEISIDDWSEAGGEVHERPGWRGLTRGGEGAMLDAITRERYRAATLAALNESLATLDNHEKLLLLYYHVEGLKLREIAKLVEEPRSPLRRWFQRQSKRRLSVPEARVHESTIMRWLEKVYGKVLDRFRSELKEKNDLSETEIELCIEMATEDLAPEDVRRHLMDSADGKVGQS